MKKIIILTGIISLTFLFCSCGRKQSPEEQNYIQEVQQYRQEKDDYMKNNPTSPFNQDSMIQFEPLKYYDVNPAFVFESKLYEYPQKDTITVYGTKGEARKAVKYGYVTFDYNKKPYKVNIYKGTASNGEEYYSIWFTDQTTGDETYGVGRYIDFDINPDSNYVYTIDFNLAYNPYCAYSARYSCAIPTKEDHLDLAVTAGEKKYH
jgi:uncharacterized protein (DUF1684 family)